ncbi:MAG: tetratricopeptide repeat protein, partial [Gammaproteobacteria bacterium]
LGEGVEPDEIWALTWYRAAAAQGHALAARNMRQLERAAGLEGDAAADAAALTQARQEPRVNKVGPLTGPPATPARPASVDEARALDAARAHGIEIALDADVPPDAGGSGATAADRAPRTGVRDDDAAPPPVEPRRAADASMATAAPGARAAAPVLQDPDRVAPASVATSADSTQDDTRTVAVPPSLAASVPSGAPALASLHATAVAGEAAAQFALARHYLEGDGIERDEAMGISWLREAARRGHAAARARLRGIYTEAGLPLPELDAATPAGDTGRAAHEAAPAPLERGAMSARTADDAENTSGGMPGGASAGADTEVLTSRPEGRNIPPPSATATPPARAAAPAAAGDESAAVRPHATRAGPPPASAGEATRDIPGDEVSGGAVRASEPDTATAGDDDGDGAARGAAGTGATPMPEGAAVTVLHVDDEPGDGVATTLAAARAALARGDAARAAALFRDLAEAGDAEAQSHYGYMLYQGEGVARDRSAAVDWYERAARQGQRDAQYNLAVAYAFGEGVARDHERAAEWYRRAAEQGSALAQYSLGVSYALGEGVARDPAQAAAWYARAAEQGYPAAQYDLAHLLHAGKGLARDEAAALGWFRQAASNGHAGAQFVLGNLYRTGAGVPQDLDEARHWLRLAAAQGHAQARATLSLLPSDG